MISATTTTTTTSLTYIVYSAFFTGGLVPSSQCTQWSSFVASLLGYSYKMLIFNGTYDTVGLTVTDPVTISGIASALRLSGSYSSGLINGRVWMVGPCGGGPELSASNSICSCPSPEYITRPCIGNSNFGGVNTATCGGPTQTMTVIFVY